MTLESNEVKELKEENEMLKDKLIEQQKKRPWYKKWWAKVKEWWYYNDDTVLEIIWFVLIGVWLMLLGYVLGLIDGDNNKNHFDAGKSVGKREGYLDAIQDLKDSGYMVYGGYGEDCGKMTVAKIVESELPTIEEVTEIKSEE